MSHKDWKGPGVYDIWDRNRIWFRRVSKDCEDAFDILCTYKKLEDFIPPEIPKEELPDGLYIIQGISCQFQALKKDGRWETLTNLTMSNPEVDNGTFVVCRVPIVPISQEKVMSVEFTVCDGCGEIYGNCDNWFQCECGDKYCDDCFYELQEKYSSEENYLTICPQCDPTNVTDDAIHAHLLSTCGKTKLELAEEILQIRKDMKII